jgi:DNA-binding transcriptional ArsR family regulator
MYIFSYAYVYGTASVIDRRLIPYVAARFKVLGAPGRLAILAALHNGERSVSQLTQATGRSQPAVSQQLAGLLRAGLVAARRDAKRVLYRIADPYVEGICNAVCASVTRAAAEQHRQLEAAARRARRRRG